MYRRFEIGENFQTGEGLIDPIPRMRYWPRIASYRAPDLTLWARKLPAGGLAFLLCPPTLWGKLEGPLTPPERTW